MARILIVEDKFENLELMVYILKAFGHQPSVARDGEEGLTAAAEQHPDLIVMDLQMPRLDGYEAARRLRADAQLRRIPLVAVSAYAMVGDREKVMAAGFDGYVTKPIDPESFVQEVERYLRVSPASSPPAL
jgi:two-component system cell cycle response regulator